MSISSLPSGDGDDDYGIVAEINVTPLTDIFLVLLIIFMVTTTVVQNEGKNIDLPRGSESEETPNGVTVSRPRSFVIGAAYTTLTLAVLVGVIRSRAAWSDLFFPMVCVAALLIATTPQLDPRFRVPLIPFLLFMSLLPTVKPSNRP